jgi:hypothetical protein
MRAFAPRLHGVFGLPVSSTTTSPLTLFFSGGGRGIRTPERVTPLTVFKSISTRFAAVTLSLIRPVSQYLTTYSGPNRDCAVMPRLVP